MPERQEPNSSSLPRDRILAAATQVFAERGFSGAGVDEIARRAGINKAMLYYHVGDKAALYAEVVLAFIGLVEAEIGRRMASETSPTARLRALHETFLNLALTHPDYPQIMMREIAAGGANLPAAAFQRMAKVLGVTHRLVSEGLASGEFRSVDPIVAHLLIVGGAIFLANALRLRDRLGAAGAVLPAEIPTPSAIADRVTDILLNGIAARPAAGGTL
ncbi:MAG TPA: TetR/AcrR family transcriptional regulator [Thermoanaerobaculaceae bacterium]|nr:TetR/AcrR family transcriptional regulator [Thermoanaerobaculaceae bacterium]HPS78724.1 TetR/AcrR family transcriptional regulator [Thermoanaerobaculaceae bacterium]